MADKFSLSPLKLALGAAFATSLAGTTVANAAQNPFSMQSLPSGYMVADSAMEGKCGGAKAAEGKCGMGMMDKNNDGNVSHAEFTEHHERFFARMDKDGDGVIGAEEMKSGMEGKCGEGKCGEGKCGAGMMKEKSEGTEGTCGGSKKGTEGTCGGSK